MSDERTLMELGIINFNEHQDEKDIPLKLTVDSH